MVKAKSEAPEKNFVVGADVHYGELSPEGIKSCYKCGKMLYFMDKWDWERFDTICTECVSAQDNSGSEFPPLTKQTIETMQRATGISVREIKSLHKKMVRGFLKKPSEPSERGSVVK